jgi:hypothetical protein
MREGSIWAVVAKMSVIAADVSGELRLTCGGGSFFRREPNWSERLYSGFDAKKLAALFTRM